jgi:DNA polymerase III alpha subunit
MGFYAPAQIVRDAREHGVAILAVDVNASDWDSSLEGQRASAGGLALRLGLRLVSGLWPCPVFTDSVARLKQPHGTPPLSALV